MKHLKDILDAAGVLDTRFSSSAAVEDGHNDEAIIAAMEAWLGLGATANDNRNSSSIGDDTTTVEDCLPLPPAVYSATVEWLTEAWNHGTTTSSIGTSSNLGASNPFLEWRTTNEKDDRIHLDRVVESIRATKWMRAWMEFNLNTEPDGTITLWDQLLQVDASDNHGPSKRKKHALVRSLFQHMQDLPVLQHQLQGYSQYLQRADPHSIVTSRSSDSDNDQQSSTTTMLSNPQQRLRQYERALVLSNRLQEEWQQHLDRLQCILGEVYLWASVEQRQLCRRLLGHLWNQFVLLSSTGGGSSAAVALRQENTQAAAIRLTLLVLRRIVLGSVATAVRQDNNDDFVLPLPLEELLFHQLIPLHKMDGMVLWRDQTAVLELYHEPLCQCMAILLQQDPGKLIPRAILKLLHNNIFPVAGNTPKQVLLLHEIDTYLRLLPPPRPPMDNDGPSAGQERGTGNDNVVHLEEETMMRALYQTLARCMSSEHSRVAERALQFFQNKSFESWVLQKPGYLELGMQIILPALVRREPSWNPTVRKMTYTVLVKLRDYNEEMFTMACNDIFSQTPPFEPEPETPPSNLDSTSAIVSSQNAEAEAVRSMATSTQDFSLRAGMGNWRPPGSAGASSSLRSMPPPTARLPGSSVLPSTKLPPGKGVAPWTIHPPSSQLPHRPAGTTKAAPPLTITGVAPWAMQQQNQPPSSPGTRQKRGAREACMGALDETTKDDDDDSSSTHSGMSVDEVLRADDCPSGLAYVLNYMKTIQPPAEEEGFSSWSRAQMAETPTYLPDLKFHGLVFGHDLGTGAFGSVKYARLIDKTKPRSQWPEYAVKVVSTEKIQEMGYEASIQREIAVLRVLSHPGIARLVSSFRFHDGAYLVLEYASRGDLHTLLQKHGSLDLASTRFVVGEVVAALASVHDLGFVYADLKPENIVITEPGHIKLTDFGGCRPVSAEAKELVKKYAKNIIKNLRDGDWKQRPPMAATLSTSSGYDSVTSNGNAMEGNEGSTPDDVVDDQIDDMRVEGTTAYLPPEVVLGSFPSFAADSWALGCVMFQCLSGRPPLLEADDEATRNRIVSFNVKEGKTEIDRMFDESHASGIPAEARSVIRSLLDRNPTQRPSMTELAESDFFGSTNVFSLYSQAAYPLDVGTVSPSPNANWARRQFSSIWAPQPEAYNVSLPEDDDAAVDPRFPGTFSDSPIPEGDERVGFFTSSGAQPSTISTGSTSLGPSVRRRMHLPPTTSH